MNARRVVDAVWPPLVFGVAFLALWEAGVEVFDLKPYFLPPPSAIWDQFTSNFELIWDATMVSGANALVGLLAGTLLGIAMSFLLMRFNLLNELLTPLATKPTRPALRGGHGGFAGLSALRGDYREPLLA